MERFHCPLALVLACLTPCFVPVPALAGSDVISLTPEEFRQLSPSEQKAMVQLALERRIEHGKNISYSVRVQLRNHEFQNGEVGKPVWEGQKKEYRHWQLSQSFRMDFDSYLTADAAEVFEWSSAGLNADQGVQRGWVRQKGWDHAQARIDVIPNPATYFNRYAYWLDGEHNSGAQYLIRFLVDNQEDLSIDVSSDDELVRLTVPWLPPYDDPGDPRGQREIWLDPQKGFLPVRGSGRWDETTDGQHHWRMEQFVVEESRLVGTVWMPIKLRELGNGSSLARDQPNVVNVWDTEVLEIEQGTVTPEDVEVTFPEGTRVIDAIKGITYKVDADGEPVGPIDSLVDADPATSLPRPGPSGTGWRHWSSLLLINVGIAILLAIYFLMRKRRMQLS